MAAQGSNERVTLMNILFFKHWSPTISSLHLRHSSFSNSSAASLTTQLILQPFRRFTYVSGISPTVRHRHFTNVTRRAAHAPMYDMHRFIVIVVIIKTRKFRTLGLKLHAPIQYCITAISQNIVSDN